jgi:RHS repeat-associated protein
MEAVSMLKHISTRPYKAASSLLPAFKYLTAFFCTFFLSLSSAKACELYEGGYCYSTDVKYQTQQCGPMPLLSDITSACYACAGVPTGPGREVYAYWVSRNQWDFSATSPANCYNAAFMPNDPNSFFYQQLLPIRADCTHHETPGRVVTPILGDNNAMYCRWASPPPLQISLTGPNSTHYLVAGRPLPQLATVTQNSSPVANKAVSINVSGEGGVSNFSGVTDGAGQVSFTYLPPRQKQANQQATGSALITATCSDCSNTAEQRITLLPNPPPEICIGNPIDPASAVKAQTETDYTDSGAHALSFTRHYRSNGATAPAGLGSHWSHNHAVQLRLAANGLSANILYGSGNSVSFSRSATSSAWLLSSQDQAGSSLQESAAAVTLIRAEGDERVSFPLPAGLSFQANATPTLAPIAASSITQRNGWITTLSYNAAGQLSQITNHFGRSLQLAYNAAGQLIQVTQPDGQLISYEYDSSSRNIRADYPGNSFKNYLYERTDLPNALTGILDETGARYATFSYDTTGRATGTQHAGGAQNYQIAYPTSDAASAIPASGLLTSGAPDPAIFQTSVQVTDPLGNPRSIMFQGGDGQVRVLGQSSPADSNFANRAFLPGTSLPSTETDFLGFTTQYQWDTTRRLKTQEIMAAGRPEQQTVSTQWHPTLRLPAQVTEQGKTTQYTYDPAGNVLTQSERDTTGGPNPSSSYGQTRTWSYTYSTASQLLSMQDARGQVWSYTYDAQGNRATSTNPAGHVSSYTYDGAGRVLTETAPNGLVTLYQYDPRGRLLQITRGSNLALNGTAQRQTTSYTYRASGQIASASLPNGHAISYTYDAAQRLTGASDNRGNQITYTLDAMGNRTSEQIKDANNQIALASSRVINSLNRVQAIQGGTNPSQQTTALQYDANGNPIRTTDPLGNATQTTLDALRRPIATVLPDGNQADSYYNQLNQLTGSIDPKGVQTSYVRNAWGEVLTETSPDIGSTSYTRDPAGNALTMLDAKNQQTTYQYDNLSRVTQITFADGKNQSFFYDGTAQGQQTGSLREMQDASGSTRYERDPFGRITKKSQTVNDNPANPTILTTSYAYTAAGELAQITYPSGLNVFYRRNASGQIASIDTQRPRTSVLRAPATTTLINNLSHTALNQPKAWSWNCITGNLYTPAIQQNCDAATRSFDADGRITATEFSTLSYDPASRITQITQNLWASRTVTQVVGTSTNIVTELYPAPFSWQAGYDNRNRLTSFNRPGSEQSYTYDANSNRLTSIAKKISDTDIDGIFEATDRAATTAQSLNIAATSNRLLGFNQSVLTQATAANGTRRTVSNVISAINYTLDANGNLTSDGLRTFDYNAENRLGQVQITQSGEAAKITYLHNAQGQRVFKSEPQAAQTLPNATELGTTFTDWLKKNFSWLYAQAQTNATLGNSYTYGDGNIPSWAMTGEYGNGGAASTGRTEYIWLPTDDGSAIPIALFRNNRYYNIHSDHLGTPRIVTDDQAKPVWQWAYSAFGDNKPTGILKATTNPNSAITNQPVLLNATTPATVLNLRFPGQYSDSETGLFYNYFRSYMPSMGAYPQMDPAGLWGGWNRRGYVGGNPLSSSDPLGLWSTEAHNYFMGQMFPGLPAEAWNGLVAGSAYADALKHQGPEFAFMHAMSSSAMNAAQSRAKMCDFIKEQRGRYTMFAQRGDSYQAFFALGMALHPVMDSTSPAHEGFQMWRGIAQDGHRHGPSPMSLEGLKTAKQPRHTNRTLQRMNDVFQGNYGSCGC